MKNEPVLVDNRETEHRKKLASKHFDNVMVKQLQYGDYVYKDVAVEFKTVKDFIGSVKDKRVFNQSVGMNEHYRKHYVIVYGDVGKTLRELYHLRHVFTIQQYLGAVASLSQITQVLKVDNEAQAFKLAKSLFEKSTDGKNRTIPKKPPNNENKIIGVLSYLGGINNTRAEKLVSEFDIHSFEELINLSEDDIKSVKGFGDKTAKNITRWLK